MLSIFNLLVFPSWQEVRHGPGAALLLDGLLEGHDGGWERGLARLGALAAQLQDLVEARALHQPVQLLHRAAVPILNSYQRTGVLIFITFTADGVQSALLQRFGTVSEVPGVVLLHLGGRH